MSPRHYQIGDRITLKDTEDRKGTFEGLVVNYRDLFVAGHGPRQKLWVRPDDDRPGDDRPGDNRNPVVLVIVDLLARQKGGRVVGEPTGRPCGPPIDLPTADHLARMILEQRDPRMPVEIQLTTLATAVLQTERVGEKGEAT